MKKVEWQSPDKGRHCIKYLLQFSWQSRWHFCKKIKLNILNQIPFYSKTQAIPKWRSRVCTSQGANLATRWFGNFVFMYFAVTPRTRAEKGPGRVWMNKRWKTQNSWLWVHGMGSSTFLSTKNSVQRHSWRNSGQKLLRANICMDRDHRARDRSRETKEQRCEENNKSSIRKGEQGRHQPRQNKLKGNVTLSWSMGLVLQQGQKARWKQNLGFLRHCKSKEKKLDKRANKTHQATTGLVLTLLNMKNTNIIPSNTFEKEIQWMELKS